MNNLPLHHFRSIQTFFLLVTVLLITILSVPLLVSGVKIIDSVVYRLGMEILDKELDALIAPVSLRYQTLQRIGLEDSLVHRREIKDSALLDFAEYRYKETGGAFVVGRDQTILLSSDFTDASADSFAAFFAALTTAPEPIEFTVNDSRRIGVVLSYPEWDAYVGIAMDRSELFAPRDLFVRINLLVLVVALLIFLALALAIHAYFITPLLQLTRYAGRVSSGDLKADIPGRFVLELGAMKEDVKRMVAILTSREEKYRAVYNAPSDVTFIHEAETGRIIEVNQAVTKLYGYTPEETLQLHIGDLSSGTPPYTLEEAERYLAEARQYGHKRFEWRARRKDGVEFWVEISLQPVSFGNANYILAVARDIDKRKRAILALDAEREQLAITLRSIGDGVVTTDELGRVVLLNKVAEQLTGWSQAEAVDRPLEEVLRLVDSNSGKVCKSPSQQVLASGITMELSGNTALIARDGIQREIADSAAPILDPESRIVGTVLVFRDVTERKRLEKELVKVKKLESVGVLAGGIAHDFNNLLTAILGNISLARMILDGDDKTDRLLRQAEKASKRAQRLTQQLLTFAKGGDPVLESVDLLDIIREHAGFVLRGSSVDYELKARDNLWQVDVDPGQIGQVVQNILLNARQAMEKEGGHIVIEAFNCENCTDWKMLANGCIRVIISDNGPGMVPEVLDRIFDPYFTTKSDGSGLGLAICHSIVHKHGGALEVYSALDKGTVFTIKLPINGEGEKTTLRKEIINLPKVESLRILVMDDEEMLRQLATGMLEFIGHQVVSVPDGEEALAAYQEAMDSGTPFDLVIMDLTIPGGMGGRQAMTNLAEIDPQARGVVSSGYSNDPVMANYQQYGFSAAMIKPFRIEDLQEVIALVMGGAAAS